MERASLTPELETWLQLKQWQNSIRFSLSLCLPGTFPGALWPNAVPTRTQLMPSETQFFKVQGNIIEVIPTSTVTQHPLSPAQRRNASSSMWTLLSSSMAEIEIRILMAWDYISISLRYSIFILFFICFDLSQTYCLSNSVKSWRSSGMDCIFPYVFSHGSFSF